MHASHLTVKRSQSECLILTPRIYSPSPVYKKASRIGANVARELFDIPPTIQEFDFEAEEPALLNLFKAKSCIFRAGADSFSEWGVEAGFSGSGVTGELESPRRESTKEASSQESLFEEITVEIPSRTSNPIVFDSKFRRNNQTSCGFPFYALHSNDINTSNL